MLVSHNHTVVSGLVVVKPGGCVCVCGGCVCACVCVCGGGGGCICHARAGLKSSPVKTIEPDYHQ